MKTILIDDIVFSDRQRKQIDREKVEELAKSIAEKGLLHAIVLIEEGSALRLVAGERRMRAIRLLSNKNQLFFHDGVPVIPGEVPYIIIDSDLDDIAVREAELEENLVRVDLSWQDRVSALDELHELRKARNPKQSIAATAEELSNPEQSGGATATFVRELHRSRIVAQHLDIPEVSHAQNLSQAYSIVSKRLEAELADELVKRGSVNKVRHTLIKGDFLTDNVIKKLPKDFTCIIADPPYGIGADKFGDAAQHTHTYKDELVMAMIISTRIFSEGYKFTLDEAHLYMFCDIEQFLILRDLGNECGWKVWRTPLIWHKISTAAHAPELNRGFRRSYELILFASKGGKPFSQVYSDVFDVSSPRTKDVAAQKPVELYQMLLSRSCLPGDRVLDPCCGSGTIFKAAEDKHLEAWGVEKDKGAHQIAQLALSELGESDETPL